MENIRRQYLLSSCCTSRSVVHSSRVNVHNCSEAHRLEHGGQNTLFSNSHETAHQKAVRRGGPLLTVLRKKNDLDDPKTFLVNQENLECTPRAATIDEESVTAEMLTATNMDETPQKKVNRIAQKTIGLESQHEKDTPNNALMYAANLLRSLCHN